jgi:hypothetical protein
LRAGLGRRRAHVIALQFRKLFAQARELFIRLHDLFVGMRELLIGAAGRAIAWYVVFRRRGVHWRFHFSVQCLPKVTADCPPARRPFLSKEWLYDGGILDRMAMAFPAAAVQTGAAPLFGFIGR